jgi:periplasmic protein TonB
MVTAIDLLSINHLKLFQMKRNEKKVPGFDEIIFEYRNKEYGAYDLRKRYASATIYSIMGAVAICAIILILYTTTEKKATGDSGGERTPIVRTGPIIEKPPQYKDPETEKPASLPKKLLNTAPEIVRDTAAEGTTMIPSDVLVGTVVNGAPTIPDTSGYSNEPIVPVEQKPVLFVEEMPAFPGGDAELLKFISGNIKYPEEAINNRVEGKVVVRFVVSVDGTVTSLEILKSVDPLLDKEAMRVVALLPKWKPGKQNGQAVPVWFFVPVTFQIKNN